MKTRVAVLFLVLLGGGCDQRDNRPIPITDTITLSVSANERSQSTSSLIKSKLDEARRLLQNGESVELELAEGTYYLSEAITLGSQHSGSSEHPFVLRSAEGAKVILSAGDRLELTWHHYRGGIYKAAVDIGSVDQLFVNGEKKILARYPNYDKNISVFNGFAADAIAPERIAKWKNPMGGFLHALHEGRWGGMHYRIVGIDGSGHATLEGGYQNNRQSAPHGKYRFVENVFEELDAPDEWFFNKDTAELFYYPPPDQNLDEANIVISRLNHLVEIRTDGSERVSNIALRGLVFAHTNRTFMETREPLLRSDWRIYRGAAVLIENAENIDISMNEFRDLGGNAIFVSRYNRNIELAGNHIHHIGANAISFVGSPDAVRSPSFTYREFVPFEEMDLARGPKSDNYPSASMVTDNLIHDIGRVEKQVAGVHISMAADITINHNTIYRVPRAGINISEGAWGGHIIEYNDVFETVLETGDHGAFNSWGRDRFWHPDRETMDKLALQHPGIYELDAVSVTTIRNNRFQCDHGWDIDLDDGSSNYHIYNNVLLSGGLKLREGFNRIVENNIVINNALHPHVWFENSLDVVRRNIFLAGHKPIWMEHWGQEIDRNLFPDEKSLAAAQSLGLDQHSKAGAPNFVDAGAGDYRVKDGSPAFDIGFQNFDTLSFGVTSPELQAKAESPKIPDLLINLGESASAAPVNFLGATVKSVKTLGEQSASGLFEASGVLVLSVEPMTIVSRAGLQQHDVILAVVDSVFSHTEKTETTVDLIRSYRTNKWTGRLELLIQRDQQPMTLLLDLEE